MTTKKIVRVWICQLCQVLFKITNFSPFLLSNANHSEVNSTSDNATHASSACSSLIQRTETSVFKDNHNSYTYMDREEKLEDRRSIKLLERLTKTHSIWLLSEMSRTGAIHLLKNQDNGTFLVRKSSQNVSLALSVQNKLAAHATVDHYLIETSDLGSRLHGSDQFFHSIASLVCHYMENQDELPYRLIIPNAIMIAKTSRELDSLAMLGPDFWWSHISRTNVADLSIHPSMIQASCNDTSGVHETRTVPVSPVISSSFTIPTAQFVFARKPCIQVSTSSAQQCTVRKASVEAACSQCFDMSRPDVRFSKTMNAQIMSKNVYFHSNLSDRMSDYEDVWCSSVSDTDGLLNCGVRTKRRAVCDLGSPVSAGTDFSFLPFRLNHEDNISTDKSFDVNVAYPSSVVMSSQHGDTSKIGSNLPIGICNNEPVPVRTSLCQNTTVSRLKSSSVSSLINICSPKYADPVDAVFCNKDAHMQLCRFRRWSEPFVSSPMICDDTGVTPNTSVKNDCSQSVLRSFPHGTKGMQTLQQHQAEMKTYSGDTQCMVDQSSFIDRPHYGSSNASGVSEKLLMKADWCDRFNRLKLRNEAIVKRCHLFTSPHQQSGMDHSLSTANCGAVSFSLSCLPTSYTCTQSNCIQQGSRFSELSTMQDIISDSMPKLIVEPLNGTYSPSTKTLSDYDNISVNNLASLSNHSTSYCDPWGQGISKDIMCSTSLCFSSIPDLHNPVSMWQTNMLYFQNHVDRSLLLLQKQTVQEQLDTSHGLTESSINDQNMLPFLKNSRLNVFQNVALKPRKHGITEDSLMTPSQRDRRSNHEVIKLTAEKTRDRCCGTVFAVNSLPCEKRPTSYCDAEQFLDTSHDGIFPQDTSLCTLHRDHEDSVSSSASNVALDCIDPDIHIFGRLNRPDLINCHDVALVHHINGDVTAHSPPSKHMHTADLQNVATHNLGNEIKDYIMKLSKNNNTLFGSSVENFIQCTLESSDKNPHHVMRNVRQFMTGIKNYLVKNGEAEFESVIEKERCQLGHDKILSIDCVIESTLQLCVLRPLRHHIYRLLVDFHLSNKNFEVMSRSIIYARTCTVDELGVQNHLALSEANEMENIKHLLSQMQRAYSPLMKLNFLLSAMFYIQSIFKVLVEPPMLSGKSSVFHGADGFLPLLIYVLVHSGMVSVEIEVDYMWGLLHPSSLTGEGGYYLTILTSAIAILKNLQPAEDGNSPEGLCDNRGENQGFLSIAFPDEMCDSIVWTVLPVKPDMTARDVCSMMALRFKITNPQEYCLVRIVAGEERQMYNSQCSQLLMEDDSFSSKLPVLAYKRLGANIVWPNIVADS